MTIATRWTVFCLLAVMALTTLLPAAGFADGNQNNKNLFRNLAIGGAAVTGYGLIHHNGTATVLGAAGTAYALSRYEKSRHEQSRARDRRLYYRRHRYYHHH